MKKIMTISLLLAMYVLSVSAQCENCSNEAIKNIMTRTSIRQYTDEPVSKADIETLLRAGMAAPTAVNKQPWHFVAITSKDKLKEMAELKEHYQAIGEPFNGDKRYWISVQPNMDINDEALKELVRKSYEIVKAKYRRHG